MPCTDYIKHYTLDAEIFDYFEAGAPVEKDSTRRIQQTVWRAIGDASTSPLPDIGSGNGWLAMKTNSTVSVDLSLKNVRRIREKTGGTVVVADANRLPFRASSFHCVVASEVLEHINNPLAVLSEIKTVTKTGGKIILSTPYKEKIPVYLCIHCNKPTPANAHLHSFSEETLRKMCAETGLPPPSISLALNKAFVQLRLSYALRFLPYALWRMFDGCFMLLLRSAYIMLTIIELQPNERSKTSD